MKMRTKIVDIVTPSKDGKENILNKVEVAGTPVIDLLLRENILGLHFNVLIKNPKLYYMTTSEFEKFNQAKEVIGEFIQKVNDVLEEKLDEMSYKVHLSNYDTTRVKNKVVKFMLKSMRKIEKGTSFEIIEAVNAYSENDFVTAVKRSFGHYIDKYEIQATR